MPLTRDTSAGAFDRVYVDFAINGSPRITWEMRADFTDPQPHVFQLQVNRNWDETDGWSNVGTSVTNQYYALDDTQRQYGKALRIAYRVVVTTQLGSYTSDEAQVMGKLSKRQWLQARAMIRRILLQPTGLEKLPGYLMKRKLHDTACTECVDPLTGGIMNSDCSTCMGTGKVDGYWKATQNTMFNLGPEGNDTQRSERGTVNDVVISGSFVGIPPIHRRDVWVDANSDRRYVVNRVTTTAELNRVPIVTQAELRLAEFGDVVYSIDPTEGS
jgi:hypothetical protein